MGTSAMSFVVIFMDLSASSGGWRTGIVGALGLLCGSAGKEYTYNVGNLG